MIPQGIILLLAVIGAVVQGPVGFFVWGLVALGLVLLVGWLLRLQAGGLLPRKVRDETVTDFMVAHADMVAALHPNSSPYERKQWLENLLEAMMVRATVKNPSRNLNVAGTAAVFLQNAAEVAEEQPTEQARIVAREIVYFISQHRLWYRHLN